METNTPDVSRQLETSGCWAGEIRLCPTNAEQFDRCKKLNWFVVGEIAAYQASKVDKKEENFWTCCKQPIEEKREGRRQLSILL